MLHAQSCEDTNATKWCSISNSQGKKLIGTRQAGAHHADPAVKACSCDPEDGEKNGVLKEREKGMVIRCRRSKGHLLSALSAKVSFGFIQ